MPLLTYRYEWDYYGIHHICLCNGIEHLLVRNIIH